MTSASKQTALYASAALVAGAFLGFVFANTANRTEIETLRAELARANSGEAKADTRVGEQTRSADAAASMPSEQEMRDLVAKADARAGDASYQREVGQGVYMYSLAESKPALMPEAIRLLKRAEHSDPKSYNTLLLLGNAHFALGQNGDTTKYKEARKYYLRALEVRPDDPDLHTLLGMTYYFGRPSDAQSAASEYRKALAANPRHEMALQNLAAALIATGATEEAARRITELEGVNSSNRELNKLRSQLAQATGAAKERK